MNEQMPGKRWKLQSLNSLYIYYKHFAGMLLLHVFFFWGVNLKQQKSTFFFWDFKPRLARVAHRHEQAQGGAWDRGAPGLKLSPKKGHRVLRPCCSTRKTPSCTRSHLGSNMIKTGTRDFPPEKKWVDIWRCLVWMWSHPGGWLWRKVARRNWQIGWSLPWIWKSIRMPWLISRALAYSFRFFWHLHPWCMWNLIWL